MISRKCTKCKEEKSVEDFGPRAAGKYGRRSVCRKCDNARAKANSHLLNRELIRKNSRNFYANNPEKRNRIWAKGIEQHYNLTAERYYKILSDQCGLCAVCTSS